MIRIENTEVVGWEHAVCGMRNPMNSWEKSDSFCDPKKDNCSACSDREKCAYIFEQDGKPYRSKIGPNDLDLMKRLRNAGTDHRKFMRMIVVYVDITAPLYWWKEFDTYKVGTVANSCSTMHKIHAEEFALKDFSCEHLLNDRTICWTEDIMTGPESFQTPLEIMKTIIDSLNTYREKYLKTKDKKYWWQMIQLLPSSYNQKRTVMMNYEVLANIYKSRKNHKLDEWSVGLMSWIKSLPYAELIVGGGSGNE